MKHTARNLVHALALTTLWSFSAVGVAQPAKAQHFNPKYNATLTVLKEIDANCNLGDTELAQALHKHLNDFINEAKTTGITGIVTEPVGVEVFHPALLAALRRSGSVDLSISTRPDIEQGIRFTCLLS